MKLFTIEEREKLLRKELGRIIGIIKEEYDPEKVILFGSLTTNNIHEWSDIDLLVVKKTSKRPVERALELGRLIQPEVGIDLFIYTPDELAMLVKEGFTFLCTILKTGEVVYEKRNN